MINFNFFKETWDLKNNEEKYDALPEIWNGHNVADFIDPEIMEVLESFFKISKLSNSYLNKSFFLKKLNKLEEEEDRLIEYGYYDDKVEPADDESKKIKKIAKKYVSFIFLLN